MKMRYSIILWIFLWIHVSNGDETWCRGDCECRAVDNSYGDTEVLCSSAVLSIRLMENNRHFTLICESLVNNLTHTISSFHLSLGECETLEIIHCAGPHSFHQLFKSLGITKIGSLAIEADESYPVILSPESLPKRPLLTGLKSLELRNIGFRFDSPNAFAHLESLVHFEAMGVHFRPRSPDFSVLKNLTTLKLHRVFNWVPQNNSFLGLQNLTLLSLTSDGLTTLPRDIFKPLSGLVIIKLSNNHLATVPDSLFAHNPVLKEVIWYRDNNTVCGHKPCVREFTAGLFGNCLSLSSFYYSSGNPLMKTHFHKDLFTDCKNLRTLHLTAAGLRSSDLQNNFTFSKLTSLNRLILYKNSITTLSRSWLSLNKDTVLNLANNPLNCSDCETLNTFLALNTIGSASCGNEYLPPGRSLPHEAWGFYNCSSSSSDDEPQNFPLYFYVAIGTSLAIILILLILIFLILTSQSIRVRLYNHHFWSIFFGNEDDKNNKYDAFISYAEEDSEYVHKVILPGLEEGRRSDVSSSQRMYTCCDHHRDWKVGEEIIKNIIQSVSVSGRTIIILSPHFLTSSWAQIEFEEAYIKRKVIMVLRGSHDQIHERLKSFPSIQNYMETFTYLKEEDPLFWEKLTYLLPHRRMQKRSQKASEHRRQITELKELAPSLAV